ncbi:Asp-tRNA(Asn)/Glu-tRNA(Gln) amidotransferase subunit GatA [Kiritimatiella glycovorans]|uniref:Glutamyl-tRNA(Gln) amidotransferase subunit A n=1 Tax=Kiritimatiella glycovorans TaxID=1307763 RepID=A0A0G3EKN7_9BACT|nr:Asp-tRNA(Asn)/Glu-tRNA(Gln) amidotransferase subunit GatA [Kiritimatiella glycovorans]AKJ65320.1 Glutamyl-tRNA(Gln) amidotransferase subunit A [Kiritimatiella glycovorans]
MADLHTLTLSELRTRLATGDCSAAEAAEAVLAAIGRGDARLGAYVRVDRERVLEQARAADERRAAGETAPLLGVPVAIKDVLNVRGEACTCGSRILEGYTAPYDATCVAKLREAGAVLLGRVNMDEFAMGSSTENSALRTTRNPWDPGRVPGGSSGGSAAGVAGGLAVASLGSDTGGSIRQPAAFCGCVGLKPTYGRVSRYGLTAFASSLDQVGPVTRSVQDAALLLGAIAGHDPRDTTSLDAPVPDYTEALASGTDLKGMTLGLPREYFVEGLDPEIESAVRAAVDHCRTLGAEIREVSLPRTRYAISAYYIIAPAEASANLARFDGIRYGNRVEGASPIELYRRTRAAGFGPEVKRRIILGTYVLSSGYYDAYYLRAQKTRTLVREDFRDAFGQCDALLTPCTPTPPYRIGEKTDDPLAMYLDDVLTTPASLAGICGLSVPCGFTDAGLPVGLQILGPQLGEETVLRVGHAYEQSTEWHTRRPPGFGGTDAAGGAA